MIRTDGGFLAEIGKNEINCFQKGEQILQIYLDSIVCEEIFFYTPLSLFTIGNI
jgi:hypothetical protein